MQTIIEKPNAEDQRVAKQTYARFKKAGISDSRQINKSAINLVFKATQQTAELPVGVILLLKDILEFISKGKTITLIPSDAELSTQQAADMMGVSRPHIVKLLEEGKIPFKKVGSHRRILPEDILQYQEGMKKTRKDMLSFLSRQAQHLNMGY